MIDLLYTQATIIEERREIFCMKRQRKLSRKQEFKKNYQLYLFLLPAVVSVFLFNYLPMYGIQIAFKDFKPARGVLGSEWVGMKWFDRFFSSFQLMRYYPIRFC